MTSAIRAGDPIVLVLHTPKEKYWGVLDEISATGVFLRGLDLNAFDAWVGAVLHKEPFIGLSDLFFPCGASNEFPGMKLLAVSRHYTNRLSSVRDER